MVDGVVVSNFGAAAHLPMAKTLAVKHAAGAKLRLAHRSAPWLLPFLHRWRLLTPLHDGISAIGTKVLRLPAALCEQCSHCLLPTARAELHIMCTAMTAADIMLAMLFSPLELLTPWVMHLCRLILWHKVHQSHAARLAVPSASSSTACPPPSSLLLSGPGRQPPCCVSRAPLKAVQAAVRRMWGLDNPRRQQHWCWAPPCDLHFELCNFQGGEGVSVHILDGSLHSV